MSILSSRYLLVAATLVGAAISYSPSVFAGSTTTILNVSASIQASCSSITTSGLGLGSINQSVGVQTYGTVNVICGGGTPYLITMDSGVNGSGTGAGVLRNMKNSSNEYLPYNLYTNGYSSIWGNDSTSGVSGTGNGGNTAHYVYISVPAKPEATNGNYTDTVTITLTY
jgi:spore coat protein U-like protein